MNENNNEYGFSVNSQGVRNFIKKVSDESFRNDMRRRMA
jgi:hypothetical protein